MVPAKAENEAAVRRNADRFSVDRDLRARRRGPQDQTALGERAFEPEPVRVDDRRGRRHGGLLSGGFLSGGVFSGGFVGRGRRTGRHEGPCRERRRDEPGKSGVPDAHAWLARSPLDLSVAASQVA